MKFSLRILFVAILAAACFLCGWEARSRSGKVDDRIRLSCTVAVAKVGSTGDFLAVRIGSADGITKGDRFVFSRNDTVTTHGICTKVDENISIVKVSKAGVVQENDFARIWVKSPSSK